jgi:hypothetical protein
LPQSIQKGMNILHGDAFIDRNSEVKREIEREGRG